MLPCVCTCESRTAFWCRFCDYLVNLLAFSAIEGYVGHAESRQAMPPSHASFKQCLHLKALRCAVLAAWAFCPHRKQMARGSLLKEIQGWPAGMYSLMYSYVSLPTLPQIRFVFIVAPLLSYWYSCRGLVTLDFLRPTRRGDCSNDGRGNDGHARHP